MMRLAGTLKQHSINVNKEITKIIAAHNQVDWTNNKTIHDRISQGIDDLFYKRLLESPRNCIEYVMMHELCHFIYPNHS